MGKECIARVVSAESVPPRLARGGEVFCSVYRPSGFGPRMMAASNASRPPLSYVWSLRAPRGPSRAARPRRHAASADTIERRHEQDVKLSLMDASQAS